MVRRWKHLVDRDSTAAVAANEEVVPASELRAADAPTQCLSDNGSICTALDTICTAERLHPVPITTPAASPAMYPGKAQGGRR